MCSKDKIILLKNLETTADGLMRCWRMWEEAWEGEAVQSRMRSHESFSGKIIL